ncbi:hypothetical protein HZA97_06035 [Candidatus Woesearchaeota archaeon]|nr:hypothetical protein [Candidatus Woesearchaeota archaeon]
MKKRGQITLFMILGLVVVFAILLLVYFSFKEDLKPQEFPKELREELQLNLQSCAKVALDESVKEVSKKIGDEKTDYVDFKNEHITKTVSLLPLFSESENNVVISNNPPDYPWTTFPYFQGQEVFMANSLFGWNILINFNDLEKILQKKFKESMQKCTSNLEKKEFIKAIPISELHLEKNLIKIQLKGTKLKSQTTEVTLPEILLTQETKLKEAYDFANTLINQEISNIKFTPESTLNYLVNIERDNFKNNIMQVKERSTELSINFVIPNRPPALQYINTSFFDTKNLLCPESKVDFNNNKLIISGGNPPPEPYIEGEQAQYWEDTSGKKWKKKHECIQKTIEIKAYDPDYQEDLTYYVTLSNPQHNLPLTITQDMYDNLPYYEITVNVDDGLKKDFQKIKLCFRGGMAC